MKLFIAILLIGAALAEDNGLETEEATKEKRGQECTNIQKFSDAASSTAELKNYDIIIVGRSTCGLTTSTVRSMGSQAHKTKCGYYFYDKQGKGDWFREVWRLVDASGYSGGGLPFGFHCGKYVGGRSEVLAAKDKTC